MASTWDQVSQAAEQKRHELVLTGQEIANKIEKSGLDDSLFDLVDLNFLEISKAQLTSIPDRFGNLSNLTNLVLHNNSLTTLNPIIGQLQKIKLLDVSFNQLESLPDEITELTELYRLNVNGNQLTSFPDIADLVHLHELDISNNRLEQLPAGISSTKLVMLTQILAQSNQITELPDDFPNLPVLKVLNVSDNKLTEIPPTISECGKLKDFHFGGNKFKDRRLQKMMGQSSSTKSVLDYLRGILEKERQSQGGGKVKGKKAKKGKVKGVPETSDEVDDLAADIINILHLSSEYAAVKIQTKEEVLHVRPYIVCAIVRNLNLKGTSNMFKRFISLQTKLHDGICQKRVAATIATHDLAVVKHPLTYEARRPSQMKLMPLFKTRDVAADKLVAKLRLEADELRKEKKRNTFSGIHKYLDLIHGKPMYPCLVDNDGVIISFPPITNCDSTKITHDTTDILIEVTSGSGLDVCKQVLDELLVCMLHMGIGSAAGSTTLAEGGNDLNMGKRLVVEQVKILDTEGVMKVVYPSRTDLHQEGFKVIRDYDHV